MERITKLKENGLAHSLKRASGSGKKRKKNGVAAVVSEAAQEPVDVSEKTSKRSTSQPDSKPSKTQSVIRDAATASLTAKVLEHEKERNKRRKLGMNENLKGLFSSDDAEKGAGSGDFMTRGYTIPPDARR